MITNPILPGFNPDPSICKVGKDYYIATSTFEWYPGVQIHHSTNLADWTLVTRPLNRPSQLDMRGNPDSCGVWAPCLSYADGLFWLVYSDLKRYDGNFKDVHNYIVTASSIEGPWAEPIYANSSGFDPSLFHDDDGRKWFYNLAWNHRAVDLSQSPRHSFFGGILMQEYDHAEQSLVGEPELVFIGSDLGLTEGPHIYKRAGYYYLVVAEGGTGYEHAVTHARGPSVRGPFEIHPDTHVITATDASDGMLQRTGHGQFIETDNGEIYHTFLCSRPLTGIQRSPMGRESGIVKCVWGEDGWLRTAHGSQQPVIEVESPQGLPAGQIALANSTEAIHYTFSENDLLPIDFQWLRTPYPERIFSLTERPGWLSLFGRESVGSWFEQALVARRQQHFCYTATTVVEFDPDNFMQMAGLVAYYNRERLYYLYLSHDEVLGKVLNISACTGESRDAWLSFPLEKEMPIPANQPIELRVQVAFSELQFFEKSSGEWRVVGPVLDASVLSDEAGRGEHASFTGAFVGMLAVDTSGGGKRADFKSFEYQPESGS